MLVGGALADKPGRLVAEAEPVVVTGEPSRYVSRGGEKLAAALDRFAVDVAGRRCLDAGASTGGFTDCLRQHGAAHVTAVDVGYGQLDGRLRADPAVEVLERTNVRQLADPDALGGGPPFEVVVADLSFISLASVVPVLAGPLAAPGADLVLLVKPQFEAGRAEVSRGRGVVRDPAVRRRAVQTVLDALTQADASIMGVMASPLLGPAGNAEYLVHARAQGPPARPDDVAGWVDQALAETPGAGS